LSLVSLRGFSDCHAGVVADATQARLIAGTEGVERLTEADLAVAAQALADGKAAGHIRGSLTDWQFHPVRAAADALAAAGLARSDGMPPVEAEHLSLLENSARSGGARAGTGPAGSAGANIVLRERDGLRSALLGSIGTDIQPRLHAIAAGLRKLQRAGGADGEVLHEMASETAKWAASSKIWPIWIWRRIRNRWWSARCRSISIAAR